MKLFNRQLSARPGRWFRGALPAPCAQTPPQQKPPAFLSKTRRATVLITVLIVVAVLALAAYRYGDLMMTEYRAADTAVRATQTRAFADSGVQYVAAVLGIPDNMTNFLQNNPWDNAGVFQDVIVQPNDLPRLQGRFSIVAPMYDQASAMTGGATSFRFGVVDESSKLNLYALVKADPTGQTAFNALMLLPNMTEDIADCLIDWVDADDTPRTSGAENETYSAMNPAYQAKDGLPDSVEELLLVQNMTGQFLFGTDTNRNGMADANEGDGTSFDPGLASYLTVYSKELNVSSLGVARTNVNGKNLNNIYSKLNTAVGQELAAFIVLYLQYGPYPPSGQGSKGGSSQGAGGSSSGTGGSPANASGSPSGGQPSASGGSSGGQPSSGGGNSGGQPSSGAGNSGKSNGPGGSQPGASSQAPQQGNLAKLSQGQLNLQSQPKFQIKTLYDLIGAKVLVPAQGQTPATTYSSPLTSATLATDLPSLLDQATTSAPQVMPGLVNVNTANEAVLTALPGMTAANVQSILGVRPQLTDLPTADTIFTTPAWLMTEAGLTQSQMQQMGPYITARTTPNIFRVQVLGYFDEGPTYCRVEAVIDTNNGRPRIVAWRDISELGKAFDLAHGQ